MRPAGARKRERGPKSEADPASSHLGHAKSQGRSSRGEGNNGLVRSDSDRSARPAVDSGGQPASEITASLDCREAERASGAAPRSRSRLTGVLLRTVPAHEGKPELAASPGVYEPEDAAMRHLAQDGQLAEVLVECDKNPSFSPSPAEDLLIAGVLRPITCPFDIVTFLLEDGPAPTPDA